MFCPNCGTENDAQATSCKKCGFNLKGAAAPKFKGTMLMVNAPPNVPRVAETPGLGPVAPVVPGTAAPRPRLKGTMLGVAPPPPGGIAPPPPLEASPAPPANLAARPAAQPAAAPSPAPPQSPPFGAPSPSVNPLGGTMIASDGGAPQAFQPIGPTPGAQGAFGAMAAGAVPPAGPPPGFAPQPAPPAGAFPGIAGAPGFAEPTGAPDYGSQQQAAQPPADQFYGGPGAGYAPPQEAPPPGYGAPPQEGPPPGYGAPPGGPYAQQPQYGMQEGYGGGPGAPYGQSEQGPGPGYGAPQDAQQGAYGQWGQQMPQGAGMMPYQGGPVVTPGMHGPIGTVRNPIAVLVLCYVTCGIYALFWLWSSISELKAFRQKDDLNPIMFLLPILSIIETWNLPPKVLEAKQLAGVPNAQTFHPVFYLFLSPYFLTADLNDAFGTALARQQRGG